MSAASSATIQRLLRKPAIQILFIVLSGGLAYSNTFHVPFVFDDFSAIVDNRKLESLFTFLTSDPFNNARWFAFATFAFNKGISGTDVTGYHIVNLIIHNLAGLTIYALVTTTLRSFGEDTVRRYAFAPVIAALAFVLHPLHTQSVTYIVQRMTSLATLLYLTAILLYAQGISGDVPADGSHRSRRPVLYLLAVISCLLAMSTKEISFTLPLVLALYDICFLKGAVRERILRLVPFFLCMLVLFYYLVGMERSLNVLSHGGGDDVSYPLPRVPYLITQLSVLCTYLRLLVLPIGQNLDYDYPVFYSLFQPQAAAAFILIMSLLCGGIYLLKRSCRGSCRSPALLRVSGFAAAWFLTTVSVESGLVPLIDKIFEHRVYLPSVWFFIMFGMLVCELYHCTLKYKNAVVTMVITLLVLSGYATYRRNHVWRDTLTLWSDVVCKSPEKERGWTSLGVYYVNKMDPARAVPFLEHAVNLSPDYYLAHAWLGRALMQLGDRDRALYHYLITTRLAPGYSKGWELAGRLLLETGQVGEAVFYLSRALELDPEGFVSQGHLQKALSLQRS
jgi:protein O-mannosyl-transferase